MWSNKSHFYLKNKVYQRLWTVTSYSPMQLSHSETSLKGLAVSWKFHTEHTKEWFIGWRGLESAAPYWRRLQKPGNHWQPEQLPGRWVTAQALLRAPPSLGSSMEVWAYQQPSSWPGHRAPGMSQPQPWGHSHRNVHPNLPLSFIEDYCARLSHVRGMERHLWGLKND